MNPSEAGIGPAGAPCPLRFWSQDPKSLIREGSGYWKYVPHGDDGRTILFLTLYHYRVRFGALGRFLDRLLFRPLIGWATAWSFDRLRLDREGYRPSRLDAPHPRLPHGPAHAHHCLDLPGPCSQADLPASRRTRKLRAVCSSNAAARSLCIGIGCAEVAIGLTLVLAWRFSGPLWLTLIAMPALVACA